MKIENAFTRIVSHPHIRDLCTNHEETLTIEDIGDKLKKQFCDFNFYDFKTFLDNKYNDITIVFYNLLIDLKNNKYRIFLGVYRLDDLITTRFIIFRIIRTKNTEEYLDIYHCDSKLTTLEQDLKNMHKYFKEEAK